MKKLFLFLLTAALLTALCCGCGRQAQEEAADGRLRVSASFYPMAEFARAVGGDHADVRTLIPDGLEPHDWEPAPRDLTALGRSRVFVYNGLVEPWAEQALAALSERAILPLVCGEGLYARPGAKADPHVWVSPKKAMLETERIRDAFCAVDPGHAAAYQENAAAYLKQLRRLDAGFAALSRSARTKKFVTAHAAFGHLAADYGLEQLAVAGVSPEAEPTAADLRHLALLMRREGLQYIFMETLATPKLTETLAREAGARVLVLDPAEGVDAEGRARGLTYLKIMERNLRNLEKALK